MNQLAVVDVETGELQLYKPQEALTEQAKDDAIIALAQRTKNWPLLEQAVEKKLDDQTDFVNWWRNQVGVRHGAGRGNKNNDDPRSFSMVQAEELTGITQQQVSKWAKRLTKRDVYRDALYGVAYKKAMGALTEDSELLLQSISNNHYTPAKYIAAAMAVMGGIDMDPASCDEAQKVVQATEFSTDGLKISWMGRIWLNPPYGGLAADFINYLKIQIEIGHVEQAIVLVNSHCTDTSWFQYLWNGVVCFTDHRINFYGDDTRSGSTHGSMFSYFGKETESFIKEFSKFGPVLGRLG